MRMPTMPFRYWHLRGIVEYSSRLSPGTSFNSIGAYYRFAGVAELPSVRLVSRALEIAGSLQIF